MSTVRESKENVMPVDLIDLQYLDHLSTFIQIPLVLFDEEGPCVEEEVVYPDDHYSYYSDMYEVNGVDYY